MRHGKSWEDDEGARVEATARSQNAEDHKLLARVLANDHAIRDYERDAFVEMRDRIAKRPTWTLTAAQRDWAARVADRVAPEYEGDLVSSGKVPRGREVATPAVLANLPKTPPRASGERCSCSPMKRDPACPVHGAA